MDRSTEHAKLPLPEPLGTTTIFCPQHGEYQATGMRLPRSTGTGRAVWSLCPGCDADQQAADKKRRLEEAAERQRTDIEAKLSAVAIPARFLGKTLDNFRAEAEPQRKALSAAGDYLENFEQHLRGGTGLIFSGMPGTGKSHLAGAILQALVPQHVGLYVTCMQAIRMVRETWRRDSERSERQVLDALGSVPLLALDEIGVQYGTDGEQTIIFDILDRRYRDMKPSLLLTNQDKAGLKGYIGERAFDRLTETCRWIAFDWPSYRTQARRESVSHE